MSAMDPLEISFTILFVSLMVFVVVETVFFVFIRGRRRTDCASRESGFRPQDLHTKSHCAAEWPFYLLCWNRKPNHHRNLVSNVGGEEDDHSYSEERTVVTTLGALQTSPFQSELVTKLFPSQGDSDLFQLQGMFGLSRLLFTIKEESVEDLASEDTRSTRGRSCRPSRGSREFLPCVSPISSPPISSSPPTSSNAEFSSSASASMPPIDESSWSVLSSSSCEALVPSSPPRKSLKILFEETCFSPISRALPVAPSTMSPSKIAHNAKCGKTTLGSLFESSSSSSGLFNLNRVYPVGSPKRERQYLADRFLSRNAQMHMEGIPILSNSCSDTHFSRGYNGLHKSRPSSPPWQNSSPDFYPILSPSSSPLPFICRSSPYRISSPLFSPDALIATDETTRDASFGCIIDENCWSPYTRRMGSLSEGNF
eukprot:c28842_g1_i1 orf=1038-2315(+)